MSIYEKLKDLALLVYNKIQKRERDLHGFDFTVRKTLESASSIEEIPHVGKKIGNSNIRSYKTSNTIFILGSGPSIRHITNKQWGEIDKHDSVGFNFWCVHEFDPTFYIYQTPEKQFINTCLDALEKSNEHYKDRPFIVRTVKMHRLNESKRLRLIKIMKNYNTFLCNELPIHSKCEIDPTSTIRFLKTIGLMRHKKVNQILPKLKSTIGLVIPWAYQMGYDNIILCGIDLKGSDHFWDYNKFSGIRKQYNLAKPGMADTDTFSDKKYSKVTVKDYIIALDQWMSFKSDVNVKVINEDTALYPEISLANV